MGFLASIGRFFHAVVDRGFRAVRHGIAHAWQRWGRPLVEKVANWFGVAPETTRTVCAGVETVAGTTADVLQAEVGLLVEVALQRADVLLQRWQARYVGSWGAVVLDAVRRIFAVTDARHVATPVERESLN